jgi:rubrerythrin
MTFNSNTRMKMLKTEIESLLKREQEMRELYTDLAMQVNDQKLREKIQFIAVQENGHVRMVGEIMVILSDYLKA